jgi:hypothetical protein
MRQARHCFEISIADNPRNGLYLMTERKFWLRVPVRVHRGKAKRTDVRAVSDLQNHLSGSCTIPTLPEICAVPSQCT